jgi:hypothetical protein
MKLLCVAPAAELPALSGFTEVISRSSLTADALRSEILNTVADVVLLCGREALRNGSAIAARQAGAVVAVVLAADISPQDAVERRALSESLFAANIVLVTDAAQVSAFPHAVTKIIRIPKMLTPALFSAATADSETFGFVRVYRPQIAVSAETTNAPEIGENGSRASLPVRAWRVLRRCGLVHVLRTVAKVLLRREGRHNR